MASVYEYIAIGDLEAKSGITYPAKYTTTIKDAQITAAERFVRSQLGKIPATATDGMVVATLLMAERFMHNLLVQDKKAEPLPESITQFVDYVVKIALGKSKFRPVSSIPMQGVRP